MAETAKPSRERVWEGGGPRIPWKLKKKMVPFPAFEDLFYRGAKILLHSESDVVLSEFSLGF